MIQQRAEHLFQHGKLKADFHQSHGREAAAVAFAIDLQPGDYVCLRSEDVMPGFVKGVSLEDTFRTMASIPGQQLSGKPSNRPDESRRLNLFVAPGAVAQIGAIREFAQAARRTKTGGIVLAYASCAPEAQTKWDAAMSFAGSKCLPVVFVVHGAWETERGPGLSDATLNGIPAIAVDASDAVAIYRVACEAIARAREGRGPTLVECVPVPDAGALPPSAERIHLQTEFRALNDPNLAMKDHLKRKGLWNEENFRQWVIDFERELDVATRFLNE